MLYLILLHSTLCALTADACPHDACPLLQAKRDVQAARTHMQALVKSSGGVGMIERFHIYKTQVCT